MFPSDPQEQTTLDKPYQHSVVFDHMILFILRLTRGKCSITWKIW